MKVAIPFKFIAGEWSEKDLEGYGIMYHVCSIYRDKQTMIVYEVEEKKFMVAVMKRDIPYKLVE